MSEVFRYPNHGRITRTSLTPNEFSGDLDDVVGSVWWTSSAVTASNITPVADPSHARRYIQCRSGSGATFSRIPKGAGAPPPTDKFSQTKLVVDKNRRVRGGRIWFGTTNKRDETRRLVSLLAKETESRKRRSKGLVFWTKGGQKDPPPPPSKPRSILTAGDFDQKRRWHRAVLIQIYGAQTAVGPADPRTYPLFARDPDHRRRIRRGVITWVNGQYQAVGAADARTWAFLKANDTDPKRRRGKGGLVFIRSVQQATSFDDPRTFPPEIVLDNDWKRRRGKGYLEFVAGGRRETPAIPTRTYPSEILLDRDWTRRRGKGWTIFVRSVQQAVGVSDTRTFQSLFSDDPDRKRRITKGGVVFVRSVQQAVGTSDERSRPSEILLDRDWTRRRGKGSLVFVRSSQTAVGLSDARTWASLVAHDPDPHRRIRRGLVKINRTFPQFTITVRKSTYINPVETDRRRDRRGRIFFTGKPYEQPSARVPQRQMLTRCEVRGRWGFWRKPWIPPVKYLEAFEVNAPVHAQFDPMILQSREMIDGDLKVQPERTIVNQRQDPIVIA